MGTNVKICRDCHSKMAKLTALTRIEFKCACNRIDIGEPDDTLMFVSNTTDMTRIHNTFIDNCSYDPAAYLVFKDCPSCGLDFLSSARVGADQTTIYTCTCGFRSTATEYEAKKSKT